jgi:hypothetical protein
MRDELDGGKQLNIVPVSASVDAVSSDPIQLSRKENTMTQNTTTTPENAVAIETITDAKLEIANEELADATTEQAATTNRTHASELIPAGSRLVVSDDILHVTNLTIWSNQMAVNLAEGKKARVITEQSKIKAAFNVLSDWRLGEFLHVIDQNGLLQIKPSFTAMAAMEDNANVGVVNAQYTGTYAKEIVGFDDAVREAILKTENEAQALAAGKAWYRVGMVAGQLKLEKRLVNLAAKADEGDEVTHMRKQIMRAAVIRDLLVAEAEGTPLLFKWEYQFGYVAAWYIRQFMLGAKEAYEQSRIHQISAKIYKQEVRFRVSLADQPEGVVPSQTIVTTNAGQKTVEVKPLSSGSTVVELRDGGNVDLNDIVGHKISLWTGRMPWNGPIMVVMTKNLQDTADYILRNGFSVVVMN